MNEGTTSPAPVGPPPATPPPSNLNQLLDWLDGRKTYLIAFLGALYVIGSGMGLWPEDERILSLFGFGAAVALRAGVKKGN